MNKTIKCRPWNVVDRVKHKHLQKQDKEVRDWYVSVHSRLNEGGILCVPSSPCAMTLQRQGKNFIITRQEGE